MIEDFSERNSTTNVERFPDGIPVSAGQCRGKLTTNAAVSAVVCFQKSLHGFDRGITAVMLDPFGVGFGHVGRHAKRQ